MALVPGGPDTELVTGILNNDVVNVTFGAHVWIAQVFTSPEPVVSWRIAAKLRKLPLLTHNLEYSLRRVDFGRPTGDDIDFAWMTVYPPWYSDKPYWLAQNFGTWPILAAREWALVIRAPGAGLPWEWAARATDELPPGITGKAWKSTNSGVDWTEIEGYFLLHQVWGTAKLTPIPPPEEVSNWAPIDYTHAPVPAAYSTGLTTDTHAHLYLRYSTNPPLKHQVERLRRGLAVPWNTYYCFTAWKEVDQQEPGDTTEHTFLFYDWPVCETRWFYCTATKRLYPTPSASPIYRLHRVLGEPNRYAWWRQFTRRGVCIAWPVNHGWSQRFYVSETPDRAATFYLYSRNNTDTLVNVYLSEIDDSGHPTGPPLVSQLINLQDGLLQQNTPPYQIVYRHTVTLSFNYLQYHRYTLVAMTISSAAYWWTQFRDLDWQGDKDEGGSDYYGLHKTLNGGLTWQYAPPGVMSYEAWAYE